MIEIMPDFGYQSPSKFDRSIYIYICVCKCSMCRYIINCRSARVPQEGLVLSWGDPEHCQEVPGLQVEASSGVPGVLGVSRIAKTGTSTRKPTTILK